MNVIDLFSGVGGFSTGLEKAGYNIVMANEIDKQIAYSYKQNHKKTLIINDDISKLIDNFNEVIDANLLNQRINKSTFKDNLSKIDLIVGGPPCQGFSMAGSRIRKSNNFIDDPRNFLFKKYFEIIQHFEPTYFILENVIGITSMNNGEILKEILEIFSKSNNFKKGGYYLNYKIFKTEEFGVPQKRRRFILIGSKINFDLDKLIDYTFDNFSNSKKFLFCKNRNVDEAISDLYFENSEDYKDQLEYIINPQNNFQKYLRQNSNFIYNHSKPVHTVETIDRISRIKQGQNWQNLKEKNEIKSVHSGAYGRLVSTEPAVTVTTRFDTPSAGRFIHPYRNSNITIREAARIQTFPDNFVFHGTKSSICKQIGNAVPPLLAEFLGYLIQNISLTEKKI